MNKLLIRDLLKSGGYLQVNKLVAKEFSLYSAVVLADLMSKEEYFEQRNQLEDNWFFNTSKNVKDTTTLTAYQQRKGQEKLKEKGILDVKLVGMPRKKYYKINYERLLEFLTSAVNAKQERKSKVARKVPKEGTPIVPENNVLVAEVIDKFNKSMESNIGFANKTERNAAEYLIGKYTYDKVLAMIDVAISVAGKTYAPVITKPSELKSKLPKLIIFFKREQNGVEDNKSKVGVAI